MGFYELQRMRIYNRKVRMNNMVEMKNQNNQCAANNVNMQYQCAMTYSQQISRLMYFVQGSKMCSTCSIRKSNCNHERITGCIGRTGEEAEKI